MDKELETVSGKVVLLERTSLESLKNENAVSGTMSLHPLIELNGLKFNFIQSQISVIKSVTEVLLVLRIT